MRFGLGPVPGATARLGTASTAGLSACLKELSNPAAVQIPDSAVIATLSSGTQVPATIRNCGYAGLFWQMGMQESSGNVARAEFAARLAKQLQPDVGFLERLVMFWSNHFSIFQDKGQFTRAMVGHFERTAIRKNVLGTFSDMLCAVYTHPCMLAYLDNTQSYGPNSKTGKGLKKTYNENLARECFELHTLGVGGGYTQNDVIALSKVLTGWNFRRLPDPAAGEFCFLNDWHEPGPQTILGRVWPEQANGVEQGLSVLRFLATHPMTAQHIAFKLIRHFITDKPSPSDVATIAKAFTASGGNLLSVSTALLKLPSAWSTPPARIRQPYPWMLSIVRGLGVTPTMLTDKDISTLRDYSRYLMQEAWKRISPDGYQDDNYLWMNPLAVRLRRELAYLVVGVTTNSTKPWVGMAPAQLAKDLLSNSLSPASATILAGISTDNRSALSVLFSSPEYLRW